jgi:hypothetical protein
MQRLGVKLAGNILDHDTICTKLVGVQQSDIHSVPKIQSLMDNEDVRLPVLRVNPHSRNGGDGNILFGLILTAVRVDADLTTFVRDKQRSA